MQNPLEQRRQIQQELFPGGIPRLWSPLLTHYRTDGSLDRERMAAHFHHVSPWIRGLLIPGTTGDGWELDDAQTLEVTAFALDMAREYGVRLLLGALRTETDAVRETMNRMLSLIDERAPGASKTVAGLGACGVCGFAVCPPRGKSLTQEVMEKALAGILDTGLPVALYQLPFVTLNEASPETFARLAAVYPNLIFFKDSSGRDLIAASPQDKGGVFLVRGGEGDYTRWLKISGGSYDGFLLSVTNVFAPELSAMIASLEAKDLPAARELSDRVTKALFDTIAVVRSLPSGNAYTNANKAMDHFFAFGPGAVDREGPRLRGGGVIPREMLEATQEILQGCRFLPARGYLE
jgi:dihydrodipicolinate synthase/N-acetylneuraminate lyase